MHVPARMTTTTTTPTTEGEPAVCLRCSPKTRVAVRADSVHRERMCIVRSLSRSLHGDYYIRGFIVVHAVVAGQRSAGGTQHSTSMRAATALGKQTCHHHHHRRHYRS